MTTDIRRISTLAAALVVFAGCLEQDTAPPAEDRPDAGDTPKADTLVIPGCELGAPGSVGIAPASGPVGGEIVVPIIVWTSGPLDAFTIDLLIPNEAVAFDSVSVEGTLAEGWFFASGNGNEAGTGVRLSGVGGDNEIPTNTKGTLLNVHFRAIGTSSSGFRSFRLWDDLADYRFCK